MTASRFSFYSIFVTWLIIKIRKAKADPFHGFWLPHKLQDLDCDLDYAELDSSQYMGAMNIPIYAYTFLCTRKNNFPRTHAPFCPAVLFLSDLEVLHHLQKKKKQFLYDTLFETHEI